MSTVREAWSSPLLGNPMYVLSQKLVLVKRKLIALRIKEGPISTQLSTTRSLLRSVQENILSGDFSPDLIDQERKLLSNLEVLLSREENIAHQKSRVQWLALGDHNTSFFHKKIATNWNSSKILTLICSNGDVLHDEEDIKQEAFMYFKDLFNQEMPNYPGIDLLNTLINKKIPPQQAQQLTIKATDVEIFNTLKSMKRNKSPGPDWFNVKFFIHTWEIVGRDFLNAVQFFLETGQMPHYMNATVIALIPKCRNPTSLSDFRPISCCNTLYKCISKLIAKRLSSTLPLIIDRSQSAFVKGRNISDNILLAQEILKGYGNSNHVSKATFKMDLHKAFDSCNWQYIFNVLILRGYPFSLIRWVHSCIVSARFSVRVNGELGGYFSGRRGIRQGDPLSPYLFILIMDVLSEMLCNLKNQPDFKMHNQMDLMELNHLCFADDLMMFVMGTKPLLRF